MSHHLLPQAFAPCKKPGRLHACPRLYHISNTPTVLTRNDLLYTLLKRVSDFGQKYIFYCVVSAAKHARVMTNYTLHVLNSQGSFTNLNFRPNLVWVVPLQSTNVHNWKTEEELASERGGTVLLQPPCH